MLKEDVHGPNLEISQLWAMHFIFTSQQHRLLLMGWCTPIRMLPQVLEFVHSEHYASLSTSRLEGNDTNKQEYMLRATTDAVHFEERLNCFLATSTFNFPIRSMSANENLLGSGNTDTDGMQQRHFRP